MVNLTVKRGEVCNYSAFIKQSFGFNNQKVLYVVPVSLTSMSTMAPFFFDVRIKFQVPCKD